MNGRRTPRKRESGFTLIEMVVALGILLIGMVSVLALFTTAVSLHKEAIDQTESSLLAEEVVSRVQGQLDSGRDPRNVAEGFAGWTDPSRPRYRVSVELADVSNASQEPEWLATVTVIYRQGTREHKETFRSVLVRDAYAALVRKAGPSS
jgi:prepilin-type N-terminal cleavage/methylation domain-containing protein